jgi:[acyl-carrier-protein] S-malonyltransferase
MGLIAFLFPGQGSQVVGMRGKTGGDDTLFRRADQVLGLGLTRLVDEGPQEELTQTANAQPALLVTGLTAATAVEKLGRTPDVVLGHSLGEYTALVQAGVLEFEDALRLVRLRGELMARAVASTPGRMAAVIGAEPSALEALVAELSRDGILEITNRNAPGQVVLSGEERMIGRAVDELKARRVGRGMPLDVSAPFHSSMMRPMAEQFGKALEDVVFSRPSLRFIDNVTGGEEVEPGLIREKLVRQLYSPVLFEQGVLTAAGMGVTTFVECGPKTVLSGLVKRIVKDVEILSSEALLA